MGAVLGVHQKFDAYPGPAVVCQRVPDRPRRPVVRAAQARFAELDHPGPFSGGGSSGVDGCTSQLMVQEHVDVPASYRGTLIDNGWRISHDNPDLVAATKNGQRFEASHDQDGSWWVWIGPAGLHSQPTQAGEVTPRR